MSIKYITGVLLGEVGRARLEALNGVAKVKRAGQLITGTARYPVAHHLLHGDEAVRCTFVLNGLGDTLQLDIPTYVFNNLPEVDDVDPGPA